MWIRRSIECLKYTDRIRNGTLLQRVGQEKIVLKLIRKRKMNWLSKMANKKMPTEECTGKMLNRRKVWGEEDRKH